MHELLGGPVKPDIPVYASALHPVGAEKVQAEAKAYVEEGYQAMKMRFPYGPGHGIDGMRVNEEHVANVRDAVGDDIEIMADAYMGWDFLYAKKMVKRLNRTGSPGLKKRSCRMILTATPNSARKPRSPSPVASMNTLGLASNRLSKNRRWTSSSRISAGAVDCPKDDGFALSPWPMASRSFRMPMVQHISTLPSRKRPSRWLNTFRYPAGTICPTPRWSRSFTTNRNHKTGALPLPPNQALASQ